MSVWRCVADRSGAHSKSALKMSVATLTEAKPLSALLRLPAPLLTARVKFVRQTDTWQAGGGGCARRPDAQFARGRRQARRPSRPRRSIINRCLSGGLPGVGCAAPLFLLSAPHPVTTPPHGCEIKNWPADTVAQSSLIRRQPIASRVPCDKGDGKQYTSPWEVQDSPCSTIRSSWTRTGL